MKRLTKTADNDLNDARIILDRIQNSTNDLKNYYYALFDNLNALFKTYPSLYKELEKTIKFPKEEDAQNIVEFYNQIQTQIEHYKNDEYLSAIINPQKNKE